MGSGANWYQIGNKACHRLKVSKFYIEKDIYVNRIGSVSLACKCVFYRPERNAKGGPHIIGFWRSWNTEIKYTNG